MPRRPVRPVAALGIVTVAALLATACTGGAPSPADSPSAAPSADAVPALDWGACPGQTPLQCADVEVPLRHDDPSAGTITLAAARLPATAPDPAAPPVVVHRGGPGFSSVEYLALIAAGSLPAPVDDTVRSAHDLVAVDQRGTGRSGPSLPCSLPVPDSLVPSPEPTTPEPGRRAGLAPYPDVPVTDAGLGETLDRERVIRDECRTEPESGRLGTVAAARDLDLVRQALGQNRLTMVGQSYGGYLATVYAALFGDRVGRFVLDSPVGPSRGVDGGTPAGRADSDVASEEALTDFLDRCTAAGQACAFGDGDPAAAFDRLIATLRAEPVALRTPDGDTVTLTAPHVLEQVGRLLYQPVTWAPLLAPYLQATAQAVADPTVPTAAQTAVGVALADLRPDEPVQAGFEAVACAEVPVPADATAWAAAVTERAAVAPHFAALRAAEVLPCVGQERTADPVPALDTPLPVDGDVLVVGNRIDPSTPSAGAQEVAALFPAGTLLVNEGPGHIAAQQSSCTVTAASAFLTTGVVPAPGTSCAPDRDPFAP